MRTPEGYRRRKMNDSRICVLLLVLAGLSAGGLSCAHRYELPVGRQVSPPTGGKIGIVVRVKPGGRGLTPPVQGTKDAVGVFEPTLRAEVSKAIAALGFAGTILTPEEVSLPDHFVSEQHDTEQFGMSVGKVAAQRGLDAIVVLNLFMHPEFGRGSIIQDATIGGPLGLIGSVHLIDNGGRHLNYDSYFGQVCMNVDADGHDLPREQWVRRSATYFLRRLGFSPIGTGPVSREAIPLRQDGATAGRTPARTDALARPFAQSGPS